MQLIRFLPVAGVALTLGAFRLPAQQPSGDDCAEAVRLVTSGEATDAHAGWALAHILSCPDGPAAIATRWHTADDRPETLAQLRGWNYQIHDQRIAEAATAVAHDASRPPGLRLVALQILVSYFDLSATVELRDLENPPRYPSLAHVAHPGARLGVEPPAEDMPDRVYALSRELAADPNPRIARAAKAVWQALTDARPGVAALPAGTLNLVNVCGRKFRVSNSSDIDTSVELITAPGRPTIQARIPARAARDLVIDVRDTAHMLFGGREVASAARGEQECR